MAPYQVSLNNVSVAKNGPTPWITCFTWAAIVKQKISSTLKSLGLEPCYHHFIGVLHPVTFVNIMEPLIKTDDRLDLLSGNAFPWAYKQLFWVERSRAQGPSCFVVGLVIVFDVNISSPETNHDDNSFRFKGKKKFAKKFTACKTCLQIISKSTGT